MDEGLVGVIEGENDRRSDDRIRGWIGYVATSDQIYLGYIHSLQYQIF